MGEQIALNDVSYEYESEGGKVLAVDHVSFSVSPSEFLCVLGPSGCGKTTILNLIAGFLVPTSGEILFGEAKTTTGAIHRGVVFQDFAQLFPWRTAQRNVEFGLEVRGVPKNERRRIATEFLNLVGLTKFAGAFPHQLSGGMQQRVAIARALAYDPGVLLMDEPFAALDAITREEMQRQLTDIWQKTQKTIVYITHNVGEAVFLADKVLVLGAHPASVRALLTLDLPRPRDPLSEPFVQAERLIMDHVHGLAPGEVRPSMSSRGAHAPGAPQLAGGVEASQSAYAFRPPFGQGRTK